MTQCDRIFSMIAVPLTKMRKGNVNSGKANRSVIQTMGYLGE